MLLPVNKQSSKACLWEFNLTTSKLHTYPYIFMSRYLEQKQALAEICISNYKPEMLFLMTFLYIHRTKYTINKQTYALNSQSQLYSKAVLMNTMLGLPQKPHLLNKENCVAEYICTPTSRIYIYKLDTINAYSQALWYSASFQCTHLPHRVISVDLLFLEFFHPCSKSNICFQSCCI